MRKLRWAWVVVLSAAACDGGGGATRGPDGAGRVPEIGTAPRDRIAA